VDVNAGEQLGGVGDRGCVRYRRGHPIRLAHDGASVAIVDMNREHLENVTDQIRKTGQQAHPVVVDLREPEAADMAVRSAVDTFGGLDALVTAAGISRRSSIVDTSEELWNHVITVNLTSVFRCCKAAIPWMRQKPGGAIVTVGSAWGVAGGPRAAAYAASKGAVVNLTRALAIDHGPEGIRANSVCPGDIDTPLLRSEMEQVGIDPKEGLLESAASRPVRRVGTVEDVAAAISFLASPESAYITGTTLVIDGGWLAGG